MYHTTTEDAKTSTSESAPNPINASEPAAMPRPIVKTASPRFHAIVAYSSRRAVRWSRTRAGVASTAASSQTLTLLAAPATPVRPSGTMAYDEELADRIRELLGARRGLTEKRMFGGLAFLIHGNMAVAASGQGGILVRVDPEDSDRLMARTHAYPMEMRGRSMGGWLRVDAEHVGTRRQLQPWVERGAAYAASLPPKR